MNESQVSPTAVAAVATEPADLASPGVGGPFSQGLLGEVRIRVTPADPGRELFVGIGSGSDVARYLAGVSHTRISDFWSHRVPCHRRPRARIRSRKPNVIPIQRRNDDEHI